MRLNVLIVDDEPLAREGLRLLLEAERAVGLMRQARNGKEAIAAIRAQRPDLVLLDVQMPGLDGFAVIEAIGAETMPAVIFITAHSQYAIRAFEISAVDYLLKPVTEDRFRIAFERARNRVHAVPAAESTQQMLSLLETIANPRRPLDRLAIRSGERTIFLPIGEVEWIEAWQNYVRIHAGRAAHLLHVPIKTLEASLDPSLFVRIHRSHIVNVKRIKQLWSSTHGQYIVELTSGERLLSGRTYGDAVRILASNPF
jgi:two-component system LytT family response regulator